VRRRSTSTCATDGNLLLGRELGPHPVRNGLLVVDKVDALLRDGRLGPALELGCLLEQGGQLGALQTVLGLAEGQDAQEEGAGLDL